MKKYLFIALAALGFAACADKLEDTKSPSHNGEVEESYIAINLMAADSGTRGTDGGYEDGTDAERAVKTAYFFFFDENGNPFNVTGAPATAPDATQTGKNHLSLTISDATTSGMPNVSDIKEAVLVLSTYKGVYPKQIVAVLNWAPTAGSVYSLDDLYAATNIQGVDNAFVMSNAVYSDGTNAVVGTPITASVIHKNETDAKANPVTIYVERIAAKVTVTANGVANNRFQVKSVMLGGSNKDVYVQVTGWELHNDFTQSTLLKTIDPEWTDLGFTWNDAAWHRCYWSTSLPFSS